MVFIYAQVSLLIKYLNFMGIEICKIVWDAEESITEISEPCVEMIKNTTLVKKEIIGLAELVKIVVDSCMIQLYTLDKSFRWVSLRVLTEMHIMLTYVFVSDPH